MKFQIRFVDKDNSQWYLYFDADECDKEKKACDKANEDLHKQLKGQTNNYSLQSLLGIPYRPLKTLSVVEYDVEKKSAKRGGIKFKLRLNTIHAIQSNKKIVKYWYEAIN